MNVQPDDDLLMGRLEAYAAVLEELVDGLRCVAEDLNKRLSTPEGSQHDTNER